MEFRDLKQQYRLLKPNMEAAILRVAEGGNYIGGAEVAQLEARLAAYIGVKHCVACANGTDALTLALMAWGVGPGDAVFVADFTYFASAEVIALCGAVPVFVDVDEETFNLDPERLREAAQRVKREGKLTPRAVIAVDLFGLPADYVNIRAVACEFGMYLLEDGAQGFGGRIRSRRACSFGDISTTSFFPAKPLGCYGDGGAVFTDSDKWAEAIRSLHVHGKGNDKYDNIRVGMNSRLDTLQAAVLLVKMNAFEEYELGAVNAAADYYTERLSCKVNAPVIPAGFYSSWAQYTVRLKNAAERDSARRALGAKGIPTMIYYPKGMHSQTAFAEIPYEGQCPVTQRLCNTVLSLPMHPYLTKSAQNEVADALLEAL